MKDIKQKITDLFLYRQLPWLGEELGIPHLPSFLESLMKLQYAIFLYDSELEKSWYPQMDILNKYWSGMEAELELMDVPKESVEDYLYQIKIYAENELSMREGKKLSDLPILKFYYYKSCDVRLMRRLMYKSVSNPAEVRYSDWLLFDMITEINDDISDFEEDLDTFNGNRFLWSIKESGWENTLNEYRSTINRVEQELKRKLKTHVSHYLRNILEAGLKEVSNTRAKMEELGNNKDCLKIGKRLVMNEGII